MYLTFLNVLHFNCSFKCALDVAYIIAYKYLSYSECHYIPQKVPLQLHRHCNLNISCVEKQCTLPVQCVLWKTKKNSCFNFKINPYLSYWPHRLFCPSAVSRNVCSNLYLEVCSSKIENFTEAWKLRKMSTLSLFTSVCPFLSLISQKLA